MAGMLSFCRKVVWLISAPVARKSRRFWVPRSSRGRMWAQRTAGAHPPPPAAAKTAHTAKSANEKRKAIAQLISEELTDLNAKKDEFLKQMRERREQNKKNPPNP